MSRQLKVGEFFWHYLLLGFITAAILFFSYTSTEADDFSWQVSCGDWSDTEPCPWDLGTEPTNSDNAYIFNGGTATVTQSDETCYSLYLGDAYPGTVAMTGGSLTVNNINVGDSGMGYFNHSAGTNTVISYFNLGFSYGSSGT